MYSVPTHHSLNYQLIRIQIFPDDVSISFSSWLIPSQVGLTIKLRTLGPCNIELGEMLTKKFQPGSKYLDSRASVPSEHSL
jgi:hypothetical protein